MPGHNFIQYEMFPQQAHVVRAQLLPSAVIANKPGIKAVHLGGRDYLCCPVRIERTNHMRDQGCFQYLEVIADGGTAYFTRRGKSCGLEQSAALGHHQLRKLLKRRTSFQAKKFLDVFGPISIHPFLEITLRKNFSEKKGRQSSPQEPMKQ